jgi:hypothetical protein
MKHLTLIAILISVLFSCNDVDDKIKKADELEELQRVQNLKEKWETLNNIAAHFGAIAGFDTLHYSLSYDYQNLLDKNKKIVLDDFDIDDVVKTDSVYTVSIHKSSYPKLFFEFTCNANQVEELLSDSSHNIHRHYRSDGKIIVVAINFLKKVRFKIESEVVSSDSEDEEPDVNLDLGISKDFIFKGQLISISKN